MKIKSLVLSVAALCCILLASCSKESPILETIPADVKIAVRLNGPKAFEALDIKNENGTFVLPDYLKKGDNKNLKLEALAKLYNSIDPSQFYFAAIMEGQTSVTPLVTAPLTDAASLEKLVKDAQTVDGYNTGKLEDAMLVWKDGQVWIGGESDAEKQVEQIKDFLKKASDKSLADVPAAADALNRGNMIDVAVHALNYEKDGKKSAVWGVSAANTKGSSLEFDSQSLLSDGSAFTMEGLADINTSALQYLPQNTLFAAAGGLTDKFDWNGMLGMALESAGLNAAQRAQLGMVIPFLQAIDGTVMMGVGLAPETTFAQACTGSFNPAQWQGILMVHMNRQKAEEIIKMAIGSAPQMGITPAEVSEGLYKANIEGIEVYFGLVDGYLTLANYLPQPTSGSALAAKFTGHQSAGFLEIPSFEFLVPGAKTGLTATTQGSGNKGKGVVTATNTDANFFPALLSLIK